MNTVETFICEFCGQEYTAKVFLDATGRDEPIKVQYAQSHRSPGDCLKKLHSEIREIRNPKRLFWEF